MTETTMKPSNLALLVEAAEHGHSDPPSAVYLSECKGCEALTALENETIAIARLAHKQHEALRRRVSEQSGHFLDCPASEEIIHFQEAKPDSCCCADDLAIIVAYDKLEAKIPEVSHG